MKVTLDAPKQVNDITYCRMRMTEKFVISSGDDYFYELVGRIAGIIFLDFIHPARRKEFEKTCQTVQEDRPARLITYLRDAAGEYQMMDIRISLAEAQESGEKQYDLMAYNLFSIEDKYMHCVDNVKRYRNYLALYNGYLFDYDVTQDCLSIFSYYTVKSTVFIKTGLSEFYDKMRAHYTQEEEIADLTCFCDRLKKAETNFSLKLRGVRPDRQGGIGMFQVDACVMYQMDRGKLVVGVIRFLDGELQDEVPIYALPEGKDTFTGLINKSACQAYVKDAVSEKNSTHYMVIVDVDNFKVVNDTYGHLYGDKVIFEIASILNGALNGRGIVSHFGGDEFLIFTDWIDTEIQIRALLTYIRQQVRETFAKWKQGCRITLSIGVSKAPEDGTDYYELFEKADKCLYLAKNKGRNRYIIYDEKKHGSISVLGNTVTEIADPVERAEQMASVVAEAGIHLLKQGVPIPAELEELCHKFQMDGIRIYIGSQGTPLYSYGSYSQEMDLGDYVTEGKMLPYFGNKTYIAHTNFINFQIVDKKLYEIMAAGGIRGTVCCYTVDKNGHPIYFFYDAVERKIIWTEADKNYFLLLSRLLTEVMNG